MKRLSCITALAAAAILVLPVAADDEGETTRTTPAEQAAVTATAEAPAAEAAQMPLGTQGMRVYRDAATGKLRAPNAAERAALASAVAGLTNRSTKGLTARTLPNGAVAVDLQGRFRSVAVATLDAEGEVDFDCVASEEELAEETSEEATEEQDDE